MLIAKQTPMINTIHYTLLLITALYTFGATASNLRGRQTLNDIFSVAAFRVHDASISSVRPIRRRARAADLLDEWVQHCSNFLTSQNVVADSLISQNEFAEFMAMQCHAEDVCPKQMKLKFEQLDINVQLKFITGICYHEDFADRSNCIYDLHDMYLENKIFGFRIDDESDNTQSLIQSMCTDIYVDAVGMGFTRTTEPTSSPSTSKMPSAVPTWNPSRSSIPSTSPSNQPTSVPATFAPTALSDETSSAPMSTAVSDSGSQVEDYSSYSDLRSPSSMPSASGNPETDVDAKPPLDTTEDHESFSRDTIIVAAAVALTLVVAGSVYTLYNHPPGTVTTKTTLSHPIHDQWDTTMSSMPLACLGLNQSISSSPCSFRDQRFINVYSSEGSPIPQFNPLTAKNVVIGTVTIGGSSYSSDFLANDCESLPGEHVKANPVESDNGGSSSLIHRTFHLVTRKNARFRHRYTKKKDPSRRHDHDLLSSSRSVHSCNTIPMTIQREKTLHLNDGSDDHKVSLGDWKAVSYMSSEFCCGSTSTSTAAAAKQNRFFFELFTAGNTLERTSCHSLPVIPRQFSFGSSDAGLSSVLSEAFFQDSSYIQSRQSIAISLQSPATPSNVLVPWRNSGFSRDVELSDGSRSISDSSESYAALPLRNKKGFFNPSKRLFSVFRKKTRAKFSLRNRQYQHLRGVELHEDPSVLSMSNSYSSQTKFMVRQQLGHASTNQPSAFPGSFAAASLPFRPDSGVPLEAGNEPTLDVELPSNCGDHVGVVKSDSASAFSRSQFESSKGWSSCSRESSSSSDSSSVESEWHNADLNCSFAEAIAIDHVHSDTAGINGLSRILSDGESSESLEDSEPSEVPEKGESDSFIGTVSLAFSSSQDGSGHVASLLPHIVSNSSDEMSFLSFPSDEMSPVLTAFQGEAKSPQLQQVVPNDDESDEYSVSVEPASSNAHLLSDEYAANVITWAIKNEMKKLEGNISL